MNPILLIILDGFGCAPTTRYNAILQAKTPNLHTWLQSYPSAIIEASGTAVGLPQGFIGNSEVGHLTIGAGRIIKQPLTIINEAIADGSFFTNTILTRHLTQLSQTGHPLHLIGLLSDAGVHSYIQHLFAFLHAAKNAGIKKVFVHAFLDGRDVPQKSADNYIQELEKYMHQENLGVLASISGRFYAMDRDNNIERTKACYDIISQKQIPPFNSYREALDSYYAQGIFDEFIPPTQLVSEGIIHDGDGVICFNFRPDRIRQFAYMLIEAMHPKIAWMITPFSYGNDIQTATMFDRPAINNTLKEVLAANHKTIFSIAETEKYAHVTYFFNGEKEQLVKGETRVIIPSIKTESFAEYPCMRAPEITDTIIKSLETNPSDFYVINYANADMVGHTGNLQATIKAVECLDHELGRLWNVVQKMHGTMYITADHGKAEIMVDEQTGEPRKAHTTSPVPFIMLDDKHKGFEKLPLHQLSDVAPYIVQHMGIKIPHEMK